jgi:hypothetical protein
MPLLWARVLYTDHRAPGCPLSSSSPTNSSTGQPTAQMICSDGGYAISASCIADPWRGLPNRYRTNQRVEPIENLITKPVKRRDKCRNHGFPARGFIGGPGR